MNLETVTVTSIVVLCFVVGEIVKATPLDDKWIPVICGISGALLGLISYIIGIPDMPAQDVINAMAVGAASGFASTGVHQVYKQLFDKNSVN